MPRQLRSHELVHAVALKDILVVIADSETNIVTTARRKAILLECARRG